MGLTEAANWSNYPKEAPNIVDLDEDPSSRIGEVVSLLPDISNLVGAAESITPFSSKSEGNNKRDFQEAMDINEEDTDETPKRKKVETEGQLVLDTVVNKGKRKMTISGPPFEVKEYTFADSTPDDSSSQSKNKAELVDKYKGIKDITSQRSLKLYSEVRNISNQDVSLVSRIISKTL